jgi:hypothetical protein
MTPTYYVNHAEITSNPFEVTISFARFPSKFSPGASETIGTTGILEVEAELQVLIPPTLLPGLIRALTTQKATLDAMMGPIFDPEGSTNANS